MRAEIFGEGKYPSSLLANWLCPFLLVTDHLTPSLLAMALASSIFFPLITAEKSR